MVAPYYPAYRNILNALGIETIESSKSNIDFNPCFSLKKIKGNIEGLIMRPVNPTGTMIDKRLMKELADYCEYEGIRLVSMKYIMELPMGNISVVSE